MGQIFQLGEWRVEVHLNRISRGDEDKQLESTAMEVLGCLLHAMGGSVSSRELLDRVWPGGNVEESVLHDRIDNIRRALGDDARNPRYIEYRPERGYRISVPVQSLEGSEIDPTLPSQLTALTPPFAAYKGSAPYVFVCYAHDDRAIVYPDLVRLREAGVHIWYDEGISPGSEWTEELAVAIRDCSHFLYFLSPTSVASRHCRDEVNFALGHGKEVLTAYIEPTELTGGLELSIGSRQALFRYEGADQIYWRKLLAVLPHTSSQTTNLVASDSQHRERESEVAPTSDAAGWRRALGRMNRYVLVGEDAVGYLIACGIGLVPFGIAWWIGVWSDRVVPVDSEFLSACQIAPEHYLAQGFGSRWNWLTYPVMLPLTILMMRYVFRRSLGYAANSPLVTESRYQPLRSRLRGVAGDWRGIAFSLVWMAGITAIDQFDVVQRLWYPAEACPQHGEALDWGWYAILFDDISSMGIVTLVAWTTAEQMISTLLGVMTAVHVFRFNSAYMNTIYVRGKADHRERYVLDFDDPDRRFGLRKFSAIFDLQLLVCFVAGVMFLPTRYMNADLNAPHDLVLGIICRFANFEEICAPLGSLAPTWEQLVGLFPDIIQVLVVVGWIVFLFLILWIANVKLLPLRHVKESDGRVAYLKQLIPPNSKYGLMLASGVAEQVEIVASRFRQHNFWPTGDRRAADALALCTLLFLLLLLPIALDSAINASIFVVGLIGSVLISRTYLQIQRYLLARVDESLVRNPSVQ